MLLVSGVEILIVALCRRNRDKLRPDEPLQLARMQTLSFTFCTLSTVYFNVTELSYIPDNSDN